MDLTQDKFKTSYVVVLGSRDARKVSHVLTFLAQSFDDRKTKREEKHNEIVVVFNGNSPALHRELKFFQMDWRVDIQEPQPRLHVMSIPKTSRENAAKVGADNRRGDNVVYVSRKYVRNPNPTTLEFVSDPR